MGRIRLKPKLKRRTNAILPRPAPRRELVPVPIQPCPDAGGYDDYKAWVLEVHADRVEPGHCFDCGKLPVDWSMRGGEVWVVCHGCGAKSCRGHLYRKATMGECLRQLFEPLNRCARRR